MDKDLLLKPRLAEADVNIPGVGTVRVRALNNAEAMLIADTTSGEAKQRRMLAFGMVDPQLSEADAGRWMKSASAGEVESVVRRIAGLSGMLDDSAKEAYKSVRDDPGPGVPVLPGAEVGHDGRAAAGGDV